MRGAVFGLALIASACSSGTDEAMRAHEISLAVSGSAAMAAWHGGAPGHSSIYAQTLDGAGVLTGVPVKVSEGADFAFEPDLVPLAEGYAVAWYAVDRSSNRTSAWVAGLDAAGNRLWLKRVGGENVSARNPVVRVIGQSVHLAWIEEPAEPSLERGTGPSPRIMHQVFGADGAEYSLAKQVGAASAVTWNLNAAVHGSQLVLTYDAQIGTKAAELQMLVIADDVVRHQALSSDDGFASLYPDMQISSDGVAALTWFDERDGNQEVYLAVAPFESLATSLPKAQRITHSKGPTIGAYAAWNGSSLGLAWIDTINAKTVAMAQGFASDGSALAPAAAIAPPYGSRVGSAGVPAIRAYDDGFLIGWNSYRLRGDAAHMDVISSDAHFANVPLTP